jgi:Zinc knuckle
VPTLPANDSKKTTKKFEDDELVLTAFSGVCFHCGKQGHSANKCPQRPDGDGNNKYKKKNFKKCLKCGKRGHLAKECWSKNPKKDGQGAPNEVGATAVSEMMTNLDEYLLSRIGEEVNNPDLWIADTGATVHMTPYKNKL